MKALSNGLRLGVCLLVLVACFFTSAWAQTLLATSAFAVSNQNPNEERTDIFSLYTHSNGDVYISGGRRLYRVTVRLFSSRSSVDNKLFFNYVGYAPNVVCVECNFDLIILAFLEPSGAAMNFWDKDLAADLGTSGSPALLVPH
jgi:hypothetical protein